MTQGHAFMLMNIHVWIKMCLELIFCHLLFIVFCLPPLLLFCYSCPTLMQSGLWLIYIFFSELPCSLEFKYLV